MKISPLAARDTELLFRDRLFRNYLTSFVSRNLLSIKTNTASYTLQESDAGGLIRQNVGTANNTTVPPESTFNFPVGTQIHVTSIGAGQTSIVAGAGVTINSAGGALKLRVQYSTATLIKTGTNTWLLMGDISL